MNLVLIGYRGTGKSEVARLLAARLGWPWFDADEQIEAMAGLSIAEIFAAQGEAAFRDVESQVIARLAMQDRSVLALGGGAVMRPENRAAIGRQGQVVWLQATPETILAATRIRPGHGPAAPQSDRPRRHNRDHRYARRAQCRLSPVRSWKSIPKTRLPNRWPTLSLNS